MSNAGQYQVLSGLLIEMTLDGWAEFKKWIDGTYASLKYAWVGDGAYYHIFALDGQVTRLCKLAYGDATDFETNFKNSKPAQPQTAEGTPLTALDAPCEADKKPVMVISPATEGTYTWLSSKGDDLSPTPPASGRGDGSQLLLTWTGQQGEDAYKEVEIQFCEPIELHDGHVSWKGTWGFEDLWSISVRLPATVATPNQGNTGNCNLVDTGYGFNVIVPADGDGAYDIDYDQAVPVPDGYNAKTSQGQGYWSVVQHWSEEISPSEPGKGEYNFYDIALEMFFCKNMDCGSNLQIWDLDAYKAEWVSKKWKLCFGATRTTSGEGKIGGYLMVFRPGAI